MWPASAFGARAVKVDWDAPNGQAASMITMRGLGRIGGCLMAALLWAAPVSGSAPIVSYAKVRADASLLVGSRVVRLYGIHVPPMGRTCRAILRPARCGSHAVLALDFKIRGFVRCSPVYRNRDRSVTALCRNRGVDLGAYLIERGWAVARPDAPFEYQVLERIARERSMGVWGLTGVAIAPASGPR